MKLRDNEEIFITYTLHDKKASLKAWKTGETWYALVKEKDGNCYLYIITW